MKYILFIFLLSPIAAMGQIKADTALVFPASISSSGVIYDTTKTERQYLIVEFSKYYKINWDKVKSFADLKVILRMVNMEISDRSKDFNKIKKYLILSK